MPTVDPSLDQNAASGAGWVASARDLAAQGDWDGALTCYERALAAAPPAATLLVEIGNLLQSLNSPLQALELYEDAVATDPTSAVARQSLGYLLSRLGEPERALEQYERAHSLCPSPMSRLLAATVLPVIYDSQAELERWRARFTARLAGLVAEGCRVETGRSQIPTPFFLAYQGGNDRQIMAQLGRICIGHDRCAANRSWPSASHRTRPRIGFLSAYFRDHTIGRLNLGLIQELDRSRFEVVVLSVGPVEDSLGREFRAAAEVFVPLPPDVAVAREQIAAQQLDLLIFADVGMDAVTSTLVYSRLAPIQCATWGHPNTTGSPAVDFFLSGDLLEGADAESHYTEQLVRLPSLGVYYHRPPRPTSPRRESYGLAATDRVYACPQTLYKFHPDFDPILAQIARADPSAVFVLLEGQVPQWTDRLRRRWERDVPEVAQRVRFLPAQSFDDFLGLFAVADVVLDPPHFGGGNTSFEALAMGTPVVTYPSPYLRGRITAALLRKMRLPELIAADPADYARRAVRVATDASFRQALREKIDHESPILFQDRREVAGFEDWLTDTAGRLDASPN